MSNEVRELSNVATIVMGLSPKGENYNREGVGLPLLNGPTEFGASHPNCTLYTTDSKRECERNDLIFCVRGNTTGRMNWADQKYSLGRGVCGIRGETPRDTRYIRYCIEARLPQLLKMAGGSTMPTLTQSTIKQLQVPYPPYRGKIASILSAYDYLIENNLGRVNILEEMAQNFYRERFVKFRFPDHEQARFVDSPLGPIPEGWEVVPLGEVADVRWGDTSITKKSYVEKGYLAFSAAGPDGKLDHYDYDRDGIVLSAIGANCGQTWYAKGKWSCIKNTIRLWATDPRISTEHLYFATMGKQFWPKRGAAQPFISQGDAQDISIIVPNRVFGEEFENIVGPILSQTMSLTEKNTILRRTRDLLLPRLISGEINVSALDIEADEAEL